MGVDVAAVKDAATAYFEAVLLRPQREAGRVIVMHAPAFREHGAARWSRVGRSSTAGASPRSTKRTAVPVSRRMFPILVVLGVMSAGLDGIAQFARRKVVFWRRDNSTGGH